MARCGPLIAAALIYFSWEQVEGADVGTCAAEGRFRKGIASEIPVSLMQTYASVTARSPPLGKLPGASEKIALPKGTFKDHHLLTALPDMVGVSEKITPPKEAFKDNHLLTAMICALGAACAAFVQAVLVVFNAMTFHFFCAVANVFFADSFRVGVAQSTVYICCYYPIMDIMQMYKFRDAERNWPLLLSYGIPLFLGLFAGLAVLHFAYSAEMVVGLQAFLLFSCIAALSIEAYTRIQKWKADNAAKEEVSQNARELPSETQNKGDAQGPGIPGWSLPRKDLKTSSKHAAGVGMNSPPNMLPSKPGSVDMRNPFNMLVAMSCGGLAGFSLGAIGIGGTFVLLMLNTLNISVEEWRCTQCVAEIPLHITRAIIVLSLGLVNWTEDWMNVVGVYIGTCIGLLAGNQFAPYISASFLRGIVLVGIAGTVVVLSISIIHKI